MQREKTISRRDFLKLASFLPLGISIRPLLTNLPKKAGGAAENILLFVFDAWSTSNMRLYGCPRLTMPNLEEFAARSVVYHNHIAAGSFTVPGTASMLSGMYPWSHRAFQLGGFITDPHARNQIFQALKPTHTTLGFSQNKFADNFLGQADQDLDVHLCSSKFHLQKRFIYNRPIFENDSPVAFHTFEDNIFREREGYDASLFGGPIFRTTELLEHNRLKEQLKGEYFWEAPEAAGEIFRFEDQVDGAIETLKSLNQPALVYMHFWPPHAPYAPKNQFFRKFSTGWQPTEKPEHPLSISHYEHSRIKWARELYDEMLLSWDSEVARLLHFLKGSGLTDNSYIFFTSDHGECFERGEVGHWSRLMIDPLLRVPLIISRPRQTQREDIYDNTSQVDILPTLAHLSGNTDPGWHEGRLLPGMGGTADPSRSVFSMDAKNTHSQNPIEEQVSFSITKYNYRLAYYKYPWYQAYEFYNLDKDPEELVDLYPTGPVEARYMQEELMDHIADANRPYERVS
ncbi:MAG: sulfatase-like hydrolase/transferase [Anaerolineales bacterium]|nr:sulfatase-like hydrolase/transferase [Anaerolineales bacterium]